TPDCKLEDGWACPTDNVPCIAAECGDGFLAGNEECDDGNTNNGDGCSSDCKVEPQPEDSGDGWVCPTPGEPCERTSCGDGVVEGSEQCDLGAEDNNHGGRGCTAFCRLEPVCPEGPGECTSACGDGILLPQDKLPVSEGGLGHECDDGNTADGDGCSSDCKIEDGFECTEIPVETEELILPIVFRDFLHYNETNRSGDPHPDFGASYSGGGTANLVKELLSTAGRPVHLTPPEDDYPFTNGKYVTSNRYDSAGNLESFTLTTSTANVNYNKEWPARNWFDDWFKDNPTYTKTVVMPLTFRETGTGEFVWDSKVDGHDPTPSSSDASG